MIWKQAVLKTSLVFHDLSLQKTSVGSQDYLCIHAHVNSTRSLCHFLQLEQFQLKYLVGVGDLFHFHCWLSSFPWIHYCKKKNRTHPLTF